MADIKWIKITTSMFEDEKIEVISSLPEADTLLIIWIRLLTLAGKSNANGYIMLTENIPYTDEMLSAVMHKSLQIVKLALATFDRFGMIQVSPTGILISNWNKYQNIDYMEKIREQNRIRKAEERKRLKLINLLPETTDTSRDLSRDKHSDNDVTVTGLSEMSRTYIEEEEEEELDQELDQDINNNKENNIIENKQPKISFEQYKLLLKEKYPELDYENEYEKFKLYWSEGKRKLKNPKLAWHNWLDKAREWKKNNLNNNGHKQPQSIPGNKPVGTFAKYEERDNKEKL